MHFRNNIRLCTSLFIILQSEQGVYQKMAAEIRLLNLTDFSSLKLGPYILPNGTQVHFSQYLIHRNEKYWRNPDVFDPERWSGSLNLKPYTYLPYLAGPRGCLGKHFAMMAMKLTPVSMLQKFELFPVSDQVKQPMSVQWY